VKARGNENELGKTAKEWRRREEFIEAAKRRKQARGKRQEKGDVPIVRRPWQERLGPAAPVP